MKWYGVARFRRGKKVEGKYYNQGTSWSRPVPSQFPDVVVLWATQARDRWAVTYYPLHEDWKTLEFADYDTAIAAITHIQGDQK